MDMKEVLHRIGYVRNNANLSARELSFRIGMSSQYIAQVESGRIVLTVEKLLKILEVCNFPLERFFAVNIQDWNLDTGLYRIFEKLTTDKKHNLVELLK
ncbi:MAG: helix-turn-helix transcriptional regulator [Clostridia bacterium]|nr:helix-turn-helix transcriptional regulator [Clostridia bacterium]